MQAIAKAKDKRKALAEGFIYEKTLVMLAADPGTGKSTITTQIAVELAAGLPIFGVFECPRPCKVLYIQTERSIIELLERLEIIGKVLPIAKDNLFVTDAYQSFNLLYPDHVEPFVNCVLRDCPNADIIFIDPIYCMVGGGLKEDVPASMFTKVMSILQEKTGAVLWYNHHTVKPSYTNKGDMIEKADPFYGSQWLKAHVTGSFYLKECKGGVQLDRKKDNYNILPKEIILEYDAETELCSIPMSELPAIEKVKAFLKMRKVDKKEFSFNDIKAYTKLCNRSIRSNLLHSSISDQIIVVSTKKNKMLYKIKDENLSCAMP